MRRSIPPDLGDAQSIQVLCSGFSSDRANRPPAEGTNRVFNRHEAGFAQLAHHLVIRVFEMERLQALHLATEPAAIE
jgi:hypothetical protein